MFTNYYELLGLDPSASSEEIRDAYRRMVREHHPDANPSDRVAAETKIKEIFAAYAVLSNSLKREDYDRNVLNREPAESGPIPDSKVQTYHHASAAVSLMGKVREVSGLSASEMAHRLGLSEAALNLMEARDSMPQSPVQLRTFTHMVDQAVAALERNGNAAGATALRAALNRRKMHRGVFR